MKTHKSFFANIWPVIFIILFAFSGCKNAKTPSTVNVTFEIQLINCSATSYVYGIVGGEGSRGWGTTNEIISGSYYAKVGQEVAIRASAKQWNKNEPGHQIICRIIVNDEDIYLGSDQGDVNKETEVYIHGPVYLPDDKDKK